MSLCIKSAQSTVTFEYKGENPELWGQSVKRVLDNPKLQSNKWPYCLVSVGDCEATLSLKGVHAVKDIVKLPQFYVDVERALTIIREGTWEKYKDMNDIFFDNSWFKHAVRHVWTYATDEGLLLFEQQVYETLLQNGNGGLSLDIILERLWKQGILKSFVQVREALEHLCTLYVVERQYGQFAPRYGMLEV